MAHSTFSFLPRLVAGLLLATLGCDAPEPEPQVELREGQTAQFKTANTDHSFTWKGCEPPWGPDPYKSEPTEQWISDLNSRIARDLGAGVLGAWQDRAGGRECDEGCASLDLAWSGNARVDEARGRVGRVTALGECDAEAIAWSVEVEASSSMLCACE